MRAHLATPRVRRLARRIHSLASRRAALSTTADASDPPAFARPKAALTNSLFPNVANADLAAVFAPTPGTVVIVQGKAATTTPYASTRIPPHHRIGFAIDDSPSIRSGPVAIVFGLRKR